VSAEKLLVNGIAERRARKEVVETLLPQTNLCDVRKAAAGCYSVE